MKEKYKYTEKQQQPTISKSNTHASSKKEAANMRSSKNKKNYGTDDDKNYEVGIVEIASNLSDLSGSTGDVDSNPDVKQMSTRNADAKEFEILIQAKHAEACKAMGNGLYSSSLEIFESILSDILARFGGKHKRVGAALHNVAIANLRSGNLDDAMDAIEEAIKIRSRALGRKHSKVTDSLVEYGIILLSMEEYDDALKVFEGALSMRKNEKLVSRGDANERKLRIAKIWNNIGCVHFEKGDYTKAREAFDEAINIFCKVYGLWTKFFYKLNVTDTGYLAMASTLCNKAYVEMQWEHWSHAIKYLHQSLEIQKELLGSENKLVKSSLDNLGYAYVMSDDYEKALKIYGEFWDEQQDSTRATAEERVETLKKIVYCELNVLKHEKALEHLGIMEDLQQDQQNSNDITEELLEETQRLMGEVNYQIFKHPSLADTANRTFGCPICPVSDDEDIHREIWRPVKPDVTSKMSGHRIAHA
ncbi:Kinesin light chain [Seminavis robusta]|uniref:Kinesin light chain n=1 Tax=Seminavis robusta TaxID=568900 RepID=A0A9N8EXH3_9STRA|nr:Kinesin light chain [Seminavis robusta]|eukprot:Sro2064_g313100.1 Kinesin light chain (475) ;mRNA; f:1303-2922